jgi:hypothetical protein
VNIIGSDVAASAPHKPGELMRLVTGALAGCGLDIRCPRHDDPCAFAITDINGAACKIAVNDCGWCNWARRWRLTRRQIRWPSPIWRLAC